MYAGSSTRQQLEFTMSTMFLFSSVISETLHSINKPFHRTLSTNTHYSNRRLSSALDYFNPTGTPFTSILLISSARPPPIHCGRPRPPFGQATLTFPLRTRRSLKKGQLWQTTTLVLMWRGLAVKTGKQRGPIRVYQAPRNTLTSHEILLSVMGVVLSGY